MRCLLVLCCLAASGQDLRLRYPLPPEASVTAVRGIVYRSVGDRKLQFDLYRPVGDAPVPVVIFLNGIGSDELKRWPIYQDWARVVTTQGLAGITMDSRLDAVAEDFRALLDYLHSNARELQVDTDRVLLWACSANVLAGLPIAMDSRHKELRAAVIYYGTGEVKDFRPDLPVLYVRSGTDEAAQNKAIDATIARALAVNAPFTVVNLPAAHHAFDARDDNPVTRQAIAQTLDFLKAHSRRDVADTVSAGVPLGLAVAAVYREDWPAAISAYQALAEQNSHDSDIRRSYADALFKGGEYARAVVEYERAITLGHHNVGGISYTAAAACMKLGDHATAMRWIEKLIDITPFPKRVAGDEVFAPLRGNPRFQEITGASGNAARAQFTPELAGVWELNKSATGSAGEMPDSMRIRIVQQGSGFEITMRVVTRGNLEQQSNRVVVGAETRGEIHGAPKTSRTEWDGDTLVVHSVAVFSQKELRLTDRFSVSPDGSTLTFRERHQYGTEPEGESIQVFERRPAASWKPDPPPKPAQEVYKNIQVMQGVPAPELQRAMTNFTRGLGVGCAHCHVMGQFEKDDKPAKQTARDMFLMVRGINQKTFSGSDAVTCWTCHRGAAKPQSLPAQ